jgi:iron-sulfur cluster assembly protein
MQNTTQSGPLINVTERALGAIRDCMADEGKEAAGSYLRIAVKGGGCSGLMYNLAIVDEVGEEDSVTTYDDVRIVVDKKSKLFLHGLTLDFTTGLNGKGFVFSNPNATGTCGCGESFTV